MTAQWTPDSATVPDGFGYAFLLPPELAAWIAAACRCGGCYTSRQMAAALGVSAKAADEKSAQLAAQRLVKLRADAEIPHWHVQHQPVYEALGEPHSNARKPPKPQKLRVALLSLEALLAVDPAPARWSLAPLEKLAAAEALGIALEQVPQAVYRGAHHEQETRQYFVPRRPLALPAAAQPGAATFVWTDVDDSPSPLLRWGRDYAAMWTALLSRGIDVSVAAITPRGPSAVEKISRLLERIRPEAPELPVDREAAAAAAAELKERIYARDYGEHGTLGDAALAYADLRDIAEGKMAPAQASFSARAVPVSTFDNPSPPPAATAADGAARPQRYKKPERAAQERMLQGILDQIRSGERAWTLADIAAELDASVSLVQRHWAADIREARQHRAEARAAERLEADALASAER